jgi:hypothetical protein
VGAAAADERVDSSAWLTHVVSMPSTPCRLLSSATAGDTSVHASCRKPRLISKPTTSPRLIVDGSASAPVNVVVGGPWRWSWSHLISSSRLANVSEGTGAAVLASFTGPTRVPRAVTAVTHTSSHGRKVPLSANWMTSSAAAPNDCTPAVGSAANWRSMVRPWR